jgi:hypothetical protein
VALTRMRARSPELLTRLSFRLALPFGRTGNLTLPGSPTALGPALLTRLLPSSRRVPAAGTANTSLTARGPFDDFANRSQADCTHLPAAQGFSVRGIPRRQT